jgi:hypothetical protein
MKIGGIRQDESASGENLRTLPFLLCSLHLDIKSRN